MECLSGVECRNSFTCLLQPRESEVHGQEQHSALPKILLKQEIGLPTVVDGQMQDDFSWRKKSRFDQQDRHLKMICSKTTTVR